MFDRFCNCYDRTGPVSLIAIADTVLLCENGFIEAVIKRSPTQKLTIFKDRPCHVTHRRTADWFAHRFCKFPGDLFSVGVLPPPDGRCHSLCQNTDDE